MHPVFRAPHSAGSTVQPSESALADPPSVCRPLWMTRSLSQCPTLSISCPTLAGQCPLATQVQVSIGSWEGVGVWVGSAFPRVPDARTTPSFPAPAPVGPFPAPPLRRGCGSTFSLSGWVQRACAHVPICSAAPPPPTPGLGRSFVRPPGFFPELFISHRLCPSGHVPLFNFSSFSPCTPPTLLPLLPVLSPLALDPVPSLPLPSPSSSGPVGDLKGTVWRRVLGH